MPAMNSAVVQRKLKKSDRLDTRNEVNEGQPEQVRLHTISGDYELVSEIFICIIRQPALMSACAWPARVPSQSDEMIPHREWRTNEEHVAASLGMERALPCRVVLSCAGTGGGAAAHSDRSDRGDVRGQSLRRAPG